MAVEMGKQRKQSTVAARDGTAAGIAIGSVHVAECGCCLRWGSCVGFGVVAAVAIWTLGDDQKQCDEWL